MRKPAILILVFLAGMFLAGFQEQASAQTANGYCADGKDKIVVANDKKANAFADGQKTVDVAIFEFSLQYFACSQKSPKTVEIKEIIFSVTAIKLIEIKDFEKIYIKDRNGKVFPARIEKIDGSDWKVIADLKARLEDQRINEFAVVADLPNMKPKASFNITFQIGKMSSFAIADGPAVTASDYTGSAVQHSNGNRPPKLYWGDTSRGVKSAISPLSGLSGEQFSFKIKYGDEDGDPPKVAQVWIDLNGDGKYQVKEKFDMLSSSPGQTDFSRGGGVEYFWTIRVVVKKRQVIKFRFYFTDGKSEAEGVASTVNEYSGETSTQKPTDEYGFVVGTPVAFGPMQIGSGQFVRGEPLRIVIPVFYLYRDIEVDWASIARNNFKPFKLLRWQLGRQGIKSPEYKSPDENFDFQEIVVFLDTAEIKSAAVNLPALKMSYGIKDVKDRFETQGEKVALQNVGLRIENGISRQLLRVGDSFIYSIKVIRSPNAQLVDFKPEETTFQPFEIVRFSKQSENRGLYIVDTYAWTLASYYAIAEPIALPSFEINWRRVGSKKNNIHKIESVMIGMVPSLGQSDNVLSAWDAGTQPWPALKTYLLTVVPITIGGLVILIFFGRWAIRRVMVWLEIWQESNYRIFRTSRRKALRLIKSLVGQREGSLVELLNFVKVLIGLNSGLTPEAAQAMTASEIETLLSVRGNSKYQDLKDQLTAKGAYLFAPKLLEKAILRGEEEVLYFEHALLCVETFLRKTKYNPPN